MKERLKGKGESTSKAFKDTSRPTEEAIILVSNVVLPWLIVRAAVARFTTPKSLPEEKVGGGRGKTMVERQRNVESNRRQCKRER